jgi:four helix bundle protein
MSREDPQFDHERLDVYWISIEFVAWVAQFVDGLDGSAKFARDQLLRSSQSIPQNIAEGNAKRQGADRRRYFAIARGSATESAASLDVLAAINAREVAQAEEGKRLCRRIVKMLVKLAPPR